MAVGGGGEGGTLELMMASLVVDEEPGKLLMGCRARDSNAGLSERAQRPQGLGPHGGTVRLIGVRVTSTGGAGAATSSRIGMLVSRVLVSGVGVGVGVVSGGGRIAGGAVSGRGFRFFERLERRTRTAAKESMRDTHEPPHRELSVPLMRIAVIERAAQRRDVAAAPTTHA